jgi:hypothetical protein
MESESSKPTQNIRSRAEKNAAFEYSPAQHSHYQVCRKLGLPFEHPTENESDNDTKYRRHRNSHIIAGKLRHLGMSLCNMTEAAPLFEDETFNKAMDYIRAFELQQMSYSILNCTVCHELRIDMKIFNDHICMRCHKD